MQGQKGHLIPSCTSPPFTKDAIAWIKAASVGAEEARLHKNEERKRIADKHLREEAEQLADITAEEEQLRQQLAMLGEARRLSIQGRTHEAATLIQTRIRGKQQRRRTFDARCEVERLAATKIQSSYRGRNGRKQHADDTDLCVVCDERAFVSQGHISGGESGGGEESVYDVKTHGFTTASHLKENRAAAYCAAVFAHADKKGVGSEWLCF